MGVRLIAGVSGSGKSIYICDKVIRAAADDPKQSYLIIVPDQFTMQTQMDFVKRSPNNGIMNIEVLSFSRLAHRVFEETGGGNVPVLDDTGKNLILRRCAAEASAEIPYLAGKLNRPGYIHEVKSAISEFMQYGIGAEELSSLIDYSAKGNKLTLVKKLKDLSALYGRFKEYIRDRYITTEEALDVLAKDIYKCHITKDSIVIFDGFTGFTPVQNKVIEALMDVAKDLVFTLTIDPDIIDGNASTDTVNESELFAFAYAGYSSIKKITQRHGMEPEIIALRGTRRYAKDGELSFMERQLFRFSKDKYNNACNDIKLRRYRTIRDDVRGMAADIKSLIRDDDICYRDIAVITGNMEAYASEIEEIMEEYGIPYYMDRNRGIVQNPFVEFIKSAMGVIVRDYSYESVFRLLRTGFADICPDDIDRLDNYVTATGLKGSGAYNKPFVRTTRQMRLNDSATDELKRLNDIREKLKGIMSPFEEAGIRKNKVCMASEYVKALYGIAVASGSARKLTEYAKNFDNRCDYTSGREYAQIYRLTMELFEQIDALIGHESMTPDEFLKLIEAGFDEIKVGTIPQSVDRVIVGDMERTRLKPVKYLFFLGLNDGWIPKDTGRGGIISDMDREFLEGAGIELSPTPRRQVYIDRFYLYTNLTKPSVRLILSYVTMDNELKAVRPSYVIEHIKQIFTGLKEEEGEPAPNSVREAKGIYADNMREYAAGFLDSDNICVLRRMNGVIDGQDAYKSRIAENAFYRYEKAGIDERQAALLYGSRLYASVSRMETYARCAYAYFLKYGLKLKEREEYGIEASDMGSIYHGVLEIFLKLLADRGLELSDLDEDTIRQLIDEAVDKEAAKYTDALLFENEKNRYIVGRMKAVMSRTVKTLAYQLKKGSFKPYSFEYEFEKELVSGNRQIKLKGRIDRVTEDMAKRYPGKNIIPAAMLYYHINDPIVDSDGMESDEAIEAKVLMELRTKGLVAEDDEIIEGLDNSCTTISDVIPVKRTSAGYDRYSETMSLTNLDTIRKYADYKLTELADRMAMGDIAKDPKEIRKSASTVEMDSCRYCEYSGVCGYDAHMPGYEKELIRPQADDEIISEMKEKLEGGSATH